MNTQNTQSKIPMKGLVRIELRDENGNLKDFRIFKNTFMQLGDAHVAARLTAASATLMGWMAIGTSGTAKTSADTTLNKILDRNALTAGYPELQTGGDDNDVKYKATWAAGDGTGAIKEAGIFNSSVAGVMLAASTFAVINKGANDSLTIVWTVTCGVS